MINTKDLKIGQNIYQVLDFEDDKNVIVCEMKIFAIGVCTDGEFIICENNDCIIHTVDEFDEWFADLESAKEYAYELIKKYVKVEVLITEENK